MLDIIDIIQLLSCVWVYDELSRDCSLSILEAPSSSKNRRLLISVNEGENTTRKERASIFKDPLISAHKIVQLAKSGARAVGLADGIVGLGRSEGSVLRLELALVIVLSRTEAVTLPDRKVSIGRMVGVNNFIGVKRL